jgi:hypothetical protein
VVIARPTSSFADEGTPVAGASLTQIKRVSTGPNMHSFKPVAVTLAMVVTDANATGEAVLRGDLDEARFRVGLLAFKAGALGLIELPTAAGILCIELGPLGGAPRPTVRARCGWPTSPGQS